MGVRREATGTAPDVKAAPQRNGFPGESKVSRSGDWISEELSDHRVMCCEWFQQTQIQLTVDTEVNE